jgi:ribonuclease HI
MPKDLVIIYTDGACSPNPGAGGWGAVLISKRHNLRTEISGSEVDSTNNRMEMTA